MNKLFPVKRVLSVEDLKDARSGVLSDIGNDLQQKYSDIFPLLALLHYRWVAENGPYENYLSRVFAFDSLIGRKALKACLGRLAAPVLWSFARLRYLRRDKGSVRIVFANSFLKSRRYPLVRASVEEKYGCTAILTLWDTLESSSGNTLQAMLQSLRSDYGHNRPIFLFSCTLAGKPLQQSIINFSNYLYRDKKKNPQQLDRLLADLRQAYLERKQWLSDRLKAECIRTFITVNQYNLRDLLLIDTLDGLGVQTVQHEHHAIQFSRINFDPTHPISRLSFAQEYSVFDPGELEFHKLVFSYDNVLHPEKPPIFHISGNTELTWEFACRAAEMYPVERKVTYMVSSLADNDLGTADQIAAINKWRMAIFEQLHLLKERTGVEVVVRYTPYDEMELRAVEVPVLERWGIKVSSSLPENLWEDMCTAGIIISTTSTVLSTALSLGKTVYRVEDPGMDYLRVNSEITDIAVEEISMIPIPDKMVDKPLSRDCFFDIERIIRNEKS